MLKNKFLSFLIFALITYSASFIGSIATITYKEPWYSTLTKASFNPPDWIFAPVWTTLYLFMTIAIWAAWHKNYRDINLVFYYLIHLIFNTTWSIIFFVSQNIFLSLLNLIILIIFIVLLTIKYNAISKFSVLLMIPYFFWCCFALLLNFYIFLLN